MTAIVLLQALPHLWERGQLTLLKRIESIPETKYLILVVLGRSVGATLTPFGSKIDASFKYT